MTGKLVIHFPGFPGHVGFNPNLQMTLIVFVRSNLLQCSLLTFNKQGPHMLGRATTGTSYQAETMTQINQTAARMFLSHNFIYYKISKVLLL